MRIQFRIPLLLVFFVAITVNPFCIPFGPDKVRAELVDRIVAIVNDDIILLTELAKVYTPFEKKIALQGYSPEKERQMKFRVREELLNRLIDEKLTDQEIKKLQLVVTESEINATIERIKEVNYYTDEELRSGLLGQGITWEEYRKQLKEQILRTKLVNYQVKSKIIITKADIKNYYDSHPEYYGGKKKYRLRNIIMRESSLSTDVDNGSAMERMEDIHARLVAGESFQELAEQYSDSPLAAKGGYLGEFGAESLSSQIKNAIEGLKPGEFTAVLDTDQGLQIFLVEDIVSAEGKSLEEVSAEIEEKLYKEIVDAKFDEWLVDLRERSHIKIIK